MDFYVHPTAIVEHGTTIGKGTKIWHFAHIREGSVIGENTSIGKGAYVDAGAKIGSNVKIQNFVSIYNGLVIEDDVFIGPSVAFTNDLYPRAWMWSPDKIARTLIKKGASIGANATIVAGITLGEYCMVGAGSVVTKTVEPNQLVYGNPAKPKGWVCKCGEKVSSKPSNLECKHVIK